MGGTTSDGEQPQPAITRRSTVASVALQYATPSKLDPFRSRPLRLNRKRDLYRPLMLIVAGFVVEWGQALFEPHRMSTVLWAAISLALVVAYFAIAILFSTIGVWIAARARKIKLGSPGLAFFKLCGITIGPGALVSLVIGSQTGIGCFTYIIMLTVGAIYWASIADLYETENVDTFTILIVVIVTKWIAWFTYFGLILHTL